MHYSTLLKQENERLQSRLTAYENQIRNLSNYLLTDKKFAGPCENWVSTNDVARYLSDILDSVNAE